MLRRHGPSFFQANRFLAPALARAVVGFVEHEPMVDLYAGVGLFAVCLAATGRVVMAIESDPVSVRDLRANAGPFGARLRVEHTTVEGCLRGSAAIGDAT